jgi:hypothetical protein
MDAEQINMLKSNYRRKNWKFNSERFGTEETIYAIYPIEDFRDFVSKSREKNVDHINIYFGAFPSDYPEYPILAGRMTLCFVGAKYETDEHGNILNKDIYYGDETSEGGVSVLSSESNITMLKRNYAEGRHKYNSETIGKPDSIGVSFNLEILEQFISEKEKQNAIGIKIYIGAYPDVYESAPEFSSMQTMILVGVEQRNGVTSDILFGDKIGLNMGSF